MISLEDIKRAHDRIKPLVHITPVQKVLLNSTRDAIHLKLENLNICGSFKIRGAANTILQLSEKQIEKGVIAVSAGNHAQGVAYVCHQLNYQADIFMPEETPLTKIEATRKFGARVHLIGENFSDAFLHAKSFQETSGGYLVHAFDNFKIIAGQGTVGLEILDQVPETTVVLVPIGGGGLISGVACALKETNKNIRVIGVQAENYPAMKLSYSQKKIIETDYNKTIADGIAIKSPSPKTLAMTSKYVDEIITVNEAEIANAVMQLMESAKVLSEGSGAVAFAAAEKLLRQSSFRKQNICCVISGGNIDINLLGRITTRGQIYSGRLMHLQIQVPDQPGYLAKALDLLGQTKANCIEVKHNRTLDASAFHKVNIDLEIGTIDADHQRDIIGLLAENNFSFEVKLAAPEISRS